MTTQIRLYMAGLVFCLLGACNTSSNQVKNDTAEPETDTATPEAKLSGNYGAEIDENGAISTTEMLTLLEGKDSLSIKVQSTIVTTCMMKGCWMNVALTNQEDMRVTFKDYGFFVPKGGVEGKNTVFEGYVKKVTTDVETLRHFAKDAGKSQEEIEAITQPKEEFAFVASGVIIKD